ncbi:MAG: 50S ribosomal protein L33 [Candidatus Margulisbacteria bacterium]|jgi:large subunit ribosomal protein L33|uniref:Large ribosomal subunit protein bL33 n=1 Tax=Termititenax aidoneus TaxID=2218524 RepID=A0A388TBV3_TERA1|nr:50S ribosomal protein L33 [Candidatus Margulisiibacteriota bacterium]MDR1323051.1 50S ribosomal protein L33 [Candidatus Margulisiibacteriota bacterium]MDR1452775.1 50S ribosomal protein L33 [Candidatus Margulisiibacteriota bacterium]MDR2428439.1 50S ribosomal protein L33 [Candidatus Margulisiibacteriota bacterium]GBR74306.1 50S ribosomal protein L33 [Candidatus Termititenax aidoneus]
MREIITLECEVCKRRNYVTTKEKRNNPERLTLKKYCKWDKKHTPHKETK